MDFPGDVLIFFRFNLLSLFQLFQYEVNVKAEGDQGVGKVAHDAYGIGAVISDEIVKVFFRDAQKKNVAVSHYGVNTGLAAQDGKFPETSLF